VVAVLLVLPLLHHHLLLLLLLFARQYSFLDGLGRRHVEACLDERCATVLMAKRLRWTTHEFEPEWVKRGRLKRVRKKDLLGMKLASVEESTVAERKQAKMGWIRGRGAGAIR
jgi:hypothetical protein